MKEELKNLLLEYYGELLHEYGIKQDWMTHERVIEKLNAMDVILGFSKKDRGGFLKNVKKIFY